jgi:hypothetical protein
VKKHGFHALEGTGGHTLLNERFDFRLVDDYAHGWPSLV